jgi:hypothetical protein
MSARIPKDPAAMTAGEVNRELERLSAESSVNCRKFIEAGRGHETWETISRAADPLAVEEQRIHARRQALLVEVRRECGPDFYEFPRGWRRKRLA